MQLDDFLNSRSIASLQLLQWFWGAGSSRSASKHELLRLLRQAMLTPERVRESFNALGPAAQDLLRALLRQEGYEADASLLLHRIIQPPPTPQAKHEVVEELSRRGFISYSMVRAGDRLECGRATVPQELGDVLAEVLNLDIREPAPMLSQRRRAGRPVEPLDDPQAIEQRIAALPDPALQRAVRLALADHAGILPLERFPSLGLDTESVDSPRWRGALEAANLGTFGHLSLLDYGLGDDHDCLVLYQELVAAHAAARATVGGASLPRDTLDHVYACGIDFLTDVLAAVDFLRANPSKLTAAGRFFKGARNLIAPQMALRSTFFMDEDTLLGFKLSAAQELGLLERLADERVHATRAAADWERLPLADQGPQLLDALLRLGEAACPGPHFPALAAAARGVLADLPSGRWAPTNAFLAQVVARFLLGRLDEGPAPGPASPAADAPWWRAIHSPATIGALAAAAREPLLQTLNYAGVLDLGRQGDHSYVAPSPLARLVLARQPLPEPAAPLLLVNPDFEVILFPDEGHLALLHRLAAFCERGKREVTLHLRITRESVQRAVLRGLSADDVLGTLRAHARAPLAQNIEYSIRNWAASVYPAEVRTLHVLELPSAAALDAALRLPELAPLVVRRLSDTAAVLRVAQLTPDAEAALRQLGIHLM